MSIPYPSIHLTCATWRTLRVASTRHACTPPTTTNSIRVKKFERTQSNPTHNYTTIQTNSTLRPVHCFRIQLHLLDDQHKSFWHIHSPPRPFVRCGRSVSFVFFPKNCSILCHTYITRRFWMSYARCPSVLYPCPCATWRRCELHANSQQCIMADTYTYVCMPVIFSAAPTVHIIAVTSIPLGMLSDPFEPPSPLSPHGHYWHSILPLIRLFVPITLLACALLLPAKFVDLHHFSRLFNINLWLYFYFICCDFRLYLLGNCCGFPFEYP